MGGDWLGLWNAFVEFYNAMDTDTVARFTNEGLGNYDITVR